LTLSLTLAAAADLIRELALRARHKLVGKLPITGELLRGSLLDAQSDTLRTDRNARGEGHQVFVLTVRYPWPYMSVQQAL
jgi:hypothetical protein